MSWLSPGRPGRPAWPVGGAVVVDRVGAPAAGPEPVGGGPKHALGQAGTGQRGRRTAGGGRPGARRCSAAPTPTARSCRRGRSGSRRRRPRRPARRRPRSPRPAGGPPCCRGRRDSASWATSRSSDERRDGVGRRLDAGDDELLLEGEHRDRAARRARAGRPGDQAGRRIDPAGAAAGRRRGRARARPSPSRRRRPQDEPLVPLDGRAPAAVGGGPCRARAASMRRGATRPAPRRSGGRRRRRRRAGGQDRR